MKIHNRYIGMNCPTYVVAEIGTNYNGKFELAKSLVDAAKGAGVDAVKFQIISADRSYVMDSESYAIFKSIELSQENWYDIVQYARNQELDCFATFVNSQDLLEYQNFEWPVYKISSTNLTNFPLLKAVAAMRKPIILSTGLSYMDEVCEAVAYLERCGARDLAILQCTSLYPTPYAQVNLSVIPALRQRFVQYPIGFSDHSIGTACAVGATVLGARIIEKHFTLDKDMEGPDHHYSATPLEMKALVAAVRAAEEAIGDGNKQPVADEMVLRDRWQRSLVAMKDIREGEEFTAESLGIKRAGCKGLEPKYYEEIIGKRAAHPIVQDAPITMDVVR